MRILLALLAAGLLCVGCGENTTSTLPSVSAIATSPPAPAVLSGVGTATKTVHLNAGSYVVSWQSPDKAFFVFCGLSSNADYGITIGLSAEPTTSKLVEDLVGGDYECQVKANRGSAWKITLTRA